MRLIKIVLAFIVAGCIAVSCAKDKVKEEDLPCTPVSFSKDVFPIFQNRCNSCHNSASSYGIFEDYAGIKEKLDNGTLHNRVIVVRDMPSGSTLNSFEYKTIRCWIEQGGMNN